MRTLSFEAIVGRIYWILESVFMVFSFWLAHKLRGLGWESTQHDKIFLFIGLGAWAFIGHFLKCHVVHYKTYPRVRALFQSLFLFGLVLSLVGFFFKEAAYSRLIVFYFGGLYSVCVILLHSVGDAYVAGVHRQMRNLRNTCLLGEGDLAQSFYDQMKANPSLGYNPVLIESLERVADENWLERMLKKHQINELVIFYSYHAQISIDDLISTADQLGVRSTVVPCFSSTVCTKLVPSQLFDRPSFRLNEFPLDAMENKLTKRGFDILFSSAVLLLASPVMLFCAVLVKCSSPGPIFFTQKRTGYNQKDFVCYKFRSMRVTDVADTLQATANDPRKTWIGEFMRKNNLDELPQFLNVLMGDMSVVGPRPHMLLHTEEFSSVVEGYLNRHHVKPGVTGWAQVNGWRGPTDTEEKIQRRVDHDLWYVKNWTLMLDIRIIFMTVFGVKTKENAF